MILTSHDKLGDTGKKTGFWLEEFAAPYYVLLRKRRLVSRTLFRFLLKTCSKRMGVCMKKARIEVLMWSLTAGSLLGKIPHPRKLPQRSCSSFSTSYSDHGTRNSFRSGRPMSRRRWHRTVSHRG